MQFEEEKSNPDEENIQNILDDIQLTEDSPNLCFVKRDNTIFIVDCCPEIMKPLPEQQISQFQKVMESYKNFMMSKIIANSNDRVGLIFYNVNKKSNSLNFQSIFTVHKLESPSAKMIKSVDKIRKDFILNYGYSDERISLHQVLWLFGQQIKDCESFKNYVRLFLFTADDNPHGETDERREQTINHARQLAAKGAQIQLFPIRREQFSKFDLRKFYQQIITFDLEDINKNLLDNSSKIMDLRSRIRQKQFKKRTLNRLLMQIGVQTFVGIQIYAIYSKAKKPACKKLQASTNKPLKRVIKRLNANGEILYNQQIGSYYPLGGERIKMTKQDMNKLKSLKKPGIALIGFKPRKIIKPYHNLRPSYFIYPDDDHVKGSSQFFDSLIDELVETEQIAIVSITPRVNQQLRFAALFPQKESYDVEDHHQTPPGFHMIYLPYSDDIVNFAGGQKTIVRPSKISVQLMRLTKLLINNLTVNDFDFRDFENPSLQKFYCHLQAHALNQQVVEEREDTIQPDYEGFQKYSDIFKMIEQTADAEVQNQYADEGRKLKRSSFKKQQKKQEFGMQSSAKKQKRSSKLKVSEQEGAQKQKRSKTAKKQVKKQANQQENMSLIMRIHNIFEDGLARRLSTDEMCQYLKLKGLDNHGSKHELADRIMMSISLSYD